MPIINTALYEKEKSTKLPILLHKYLSLKFGLIDILISKNKLKERVDIPLFHFAITKPVFFSTQNEKEENYLSIETSSFSPV